MNRSSWHRQTVLRVASVLLLSAMLWAARAHAEVAELGGALQPAGMSATLTPQDLAADLAEPLVATSPTTHDEDVSLLQALKSYRERASIDDLRPLEAFASDYPQSGWRVAVLANLGFLDLHYGYVSRAIEAWEVAWRVGKGATDPQAKALVDRVVGELARLQAGLGHAEQLKVLLLDIGDRPISGPATESLQAAWETVEVMRTDARHLLICGPLALKALLLDQGATPEQVHFLDMYNAGLKGVSLAELEQLAQRANLRYASVLRTPDAPVPVPSVIHLKEGHFAAILREVDGQYQIKDPILTQDTLWISKAAIDAEGSGYFLAPVDSQSSGTWLTVAEDDSQRVWGAGQTAGNKQGTAQPPKCGIDGAPCSCPGMCGYSIEEMVVGLALVDTPVGYTPPKGPSAKVTLVYNQREDSQPANFSFFNVSQKWTLSWLSYVQDNPTSPGSSVSRYLRGGGAYYYVGYNATTGAFTPQTDDASVLTLTSKSPATYQRLLKDGSVETYARSDGSTSSPRRIFLTAIADPAGNTVTLNYDATLRLTSITDATGRSTTFSYGLAAKPLLVTAITDPFGRSAKLTYDASFRLSSITDVIGLTSSFAYDASSLINALTTPYGTTKFAYNTASTPRTLQVTDPLGYSERVEFLQPAPVSASDPATTVPKGMNVQNVYLYYRDSFHWDKHAYVVAGCTASGGCDYSKARVTHYNHDSTNTNYEAASVESIKYPLENRIWITHPGQSSSYYSGSYEKPSAIGRVLDDGTTQLAQFAYNTSGNLTSVTDPVGRQTLLTYATNGVDLTQFQQKTSASGNSTIAQFTYNNQHLPLTYTDAAGQTTTYAYNAAGQLTSVKNALGQTTSFQYDGLGYLTSVINANGATALTLAYDAQGRVATRTDSEGLTVSYSYDAMDRVTRETYADGTTRDYTWNRLDLTAVKDRQGRVTNFTYDAVRNLVAVADPLGQQTKLGYFENQKLKTLTDPNGNTTSWGIDLQSRVTGKTYADGTVVGTAYETTTSRVKTITDALGQKTQFSYALDNRPTAIQYLNAINATPNVGFAYDPYFPRVTSMTDGSGLNSYTYQTVGALGALNLAQERSPFANTTISYQYDALGRLTSRSVGGNVETFGFDALGRPTSHTSDLGSFTLAYLGQTSQLTSRSNGIVGSSWSYDTNVNDRRLTAISNGGQARSFQYTTRPEYDISGVSELLGGVQQQSWTYSHDRADQLSSATSSSGAQYNYTYDAAGNTSTIQRPTFTDRVGYNGLNQITNFRGALFTYDRNGNLLQDDRYTYKWDAANRLLSINYLVSPSLGSRFRYDGLGRRIAIVSQSGSAIVETRYLWCGETLCQSRRDNDLPVRRYFAEGEEAVSSNTLLYYGVDHLGSIRDVFSAQTGSHIGTSDYDPYGGSTQPAGGIATDFRYAGLFYHQQSGLLLATYRAYDSRPGNWLSRDPSGETGDNNLYRYAGRNPVSAIDKNGEFLQYVIPVVIVGTIATIHYTRNYWNQDVTYSDAQKYWEELPPEKAIWHRQGPGAENNRKFVSPDGGNSEAVFDQFGCPVTNPTNMATYNFFGPDFLHGIPHGVTDVLPYFAFGNTPGDMFTSDRFATTWNHLFGSPAPKLTPVPQGQ